MKKLSKRIETLQKKLECDAFLIEDPTSILYLTGLSLSLGQLLVTKEEATLFVDGRYLQACQEAHVCEVASRDALKEDLQKIPEVSFDKTRATYAQVEALKAWHVHVKAAKSPVDGMRWIKDPSEIAATERSVALLKEGYEYILSILEPGVTEKEIATAFHIEMLKRGAESLSFDPIIAFGVNSAKPHYRAGGGKLKKDDIALIDIGVVVDSYCSDMTRTHLLGDVSAEIHELYRVTKEAAKAAIALCRPGVSFGALDAKAREVMREAGLEKYFLHTLGHGIGLEVHEGFRIKWDAPGCDMLLAPGMIFTVEPGLYKEGLGGIRHEEMVLITQEGHRILTPK